MNFSKTQRVLDKQIILHNFLIFFWSNKKIEDRSFNNDRIRTPFTNFNKICSLWSSCYQNCFISAFFKITLHKLITFNDSGLVSSTSYKLGFTKTKLLWVIISMFSNMFYIQEDVTHLGPHGHMIISSRWMLRSPKLEYCQQLFWLF